MFYSIKRVVQEQAIKWQHDYPTKIHEYNHNT